MKKYYASCSIPKNTTFHKSMVDDVVMYKYNYKSSYKYKMQEAKRVCVSFRRVNFVHVVSSGTKLTWYP